jgi:hypothetical protein
MANEMNDLKSILSSKNFDVNQDSFGGKLNQSDWCCSFWIFGCWSYSPCWNYQPAPCNTMA